MKIKSSFQDSIYKLLCASFCHAVNSSWFQLNLKIKGFTRDYAFVHVLYVLSGKNFRKLSWSGFSLENCPL